jgi:hypothetical protein
MTIAHPAKTMKGAYFIAAAISVALWRIIAR